MTQRERSLSILIMSIVVGLGGAVYLVKSWFLTPLGNYDNQIIVLGDEIDRKDREFNKVLLDKQELHNKWQARSLPTNQDQAANEYGQYLRDVLKKSKLTLRELLASPPSDPKTPAPGAAPKKHGHTVLTFTVHGSGTWNQMVHALELFQRTPLMHRVKTLNLTRDASGKDAKEPNPKLTFMMVVEALILNNAPKQNDHLLSPGSQQLPPVPAGRDYPALERKNVFTGEIPLLVAKKDPTPEGLDMRKFVQLVTITASSNEAHLRNKALGFREMRIGTAKGMQSIRIMDETDTKEVIKGKVLKVDHRNVYFMVDEDVYAFHIGDTLEEAMSHRLTDDELRAVGLLDAVYAELRSLDAAKKQEKKKSSTKR
jgi:hypothetical protein